jgi:hypothetical protein
MPMLQHKEFGTNSLKKKFCRMYGLAMMLSFSSTKNYNQYVKFRYPEKATKIGAIFLKVWTIPSNFQTLRKIMAFSEYINFTCSYHSKAENLIFLKLSNQLFLTPHGTIFFKKGTPFNVHQLSKFPEFLSSVYTAIYEYPCTYMLAFNIAGVAGVANRQTGRRISFTGGLCL